MVPPPDGGIPISEWSGSGATDRLRQTMIDLDESTKAQTRTLVRLTWSLAAMTLALVILTIVLVVDAL